MVYFYAILTIFIGFIAFYLSFNKRNKNMIQSLGVFLLWILFIVVSFLWIGKANINLKEKLDYLYRTNQVERKCGVFKKYMYLGAGKNGKTKFLIFHYKENNSIHSVHAWCTYQDYQACDLQDDLLNGEKICITYVMRSSEKFADLYEIKRIK